MATDLNAYRLALDPSWTVTEPASGLIVATRVDDLGDTWSLVAWFDALGRMVDVATLAVHHEGQLGARQATETGSWDAMLILAGLAAGERPDVAALPT